MRATITMAMLALIAVAGCGSETATEDTVASRSPASESAPTQSEPTSASSEPALPASSETTLPDPAEPGESTSPTEITAAEHETEAVVWPQPVGYHEAVYDAADDSVLIVGGCYGAQCTPRYLAWRLDARDATWTKLLPVPSSVAGAAMAYDVESDVVVALQGVFGDVARDPVGTWVYDRVADEWTDVEADPQPRMGTGVRMVYDVESDRIIAFGGVGFGDEGLVWTEGTWAYDVDTNTWTDMEPATPPPPINFYAFSYDAESDRAVLFGLRPDDESLLWSYDYNTNTWEELERAGGPPRAPAYGRSFYHPPTDRIVYVGGTGPPETSPDAIDLVWAYDLDTNSWTDLGPSTVPGAIGWHTLTYVESIDRAVVFGGGPTYADYYGDRLFDYEPEANTWSEIVAE